MNTVRMRIVSGHSLAMFLLSWLFLFLIRSFSTSVLALSIGIPVEIKFYKVFFLIPPSSWNADMVKLLFISPQIVAFVFALACFVVVYNVNRYSGIFKLFFIWGFIHGWSACFGGMLVGMMTNTGFGYATEWMYLFDTMKLVLSLFSLFMLISGGFLISHSWQMSSNIYFNEIKEDMFPRFLFFQVTEVAVIGTLLQVVLSIPAPPELQYVNPTIIVMLLPVILKASGFSDLQFDDLPRFFNLNKRLLIVVAVAVVVFRIVFGIGIHIGSLDA